MGPQGKRQGAIWNRTSITLALAPAALLGLLAGEPAKVGGAGRICVAPLPKQAAEIDKEYRGRKPRREYTYRFAVKVDAGDWVELPREHGQAIEGIPAGRSHTVQVRDGDQLIETFSFTFEEKHALDLCLSYTPWYQTWRLEPPPPRAWWCKCEERAK